MTSHQGQSTYEIQAIMERYFGHVRIEESEPVYDVTMRRYARVFAQDPIKKRQI